MSDDKHPESNDFSKAEKGIEDYHVVSDDRYRFDAADLDRVQRRLKQRHVQM
jgi:amino acid transporter